MLPIAEAARAGFPAYELDEAQATEVRYGRKLPVLLHDTGAVALFAPDGEFLALYQQVPDVTEPLAAAVAVFV